MAFYETTFLARPDISSQAVEKLTNDISGVITENGGKVLKTEYWGLRTLAYLVKKNRKAHYSHIGFSASHEVVKKLEKSLRYNEDVLRSAIINIEEVDKKPSPLIDDRERTVEEAN